MVMSITWWCVVPPWVGCFSTWMATRGMYLTRVSDLAVNRSGPCDVMSHVSRRARASHVRRTGVVLGGLAALCAWFGMAPAASAHTAGAPPPGSDYLTTIHQRADGVTVRVIDGGDRLELTLDRAKEAVVSGF